MTHGIRTTPARPSPAQRPTFTPTAARCTGGCTTLTQLPATGWTQDAWGWLCPTHARTDRPAVTA